MHPRGSHSKKDLSVNIDNTLQLDPITAIVLPFLTD
jgi:hypothetical protein